MGGVCVLMCGGGVVVYDVVVDVCGEGCGCMGRGCVGCVWVMCGVVVM